MKVSKSQLAVEYVLEVLKLDPAKVPGGDMNTSKMFLLYHDMMDRLDTRFGARSKKVKLQTDDVAEFTIWMETQMVDIGYNADDAQTLSGPVIDKIAARLKRQSDKEQSKINKSPAGRKRLIDQRRNV